MDKKVVYRIAFRNNTTGMEHKGNITFNVEDEAKSHCDILNNERFATLKALGEYIYIKEYV